LCYIGITAAFIAAFIYYYFILYQATYADGFSIWLRHNTRFIMIAVVRSRIHQLNGSCQIDFGIFILTALAQWRERGSVREAGSSPSNLSNALQSTNIGCCCCCCTNCSRSRRMAKMTNCRRSRCASCSSEHGQ